MRQGDSLYYRINISLKMVKHRKRGAISFMGFKPTKGRVVT